MKKMHYTDGYGGNFNYAAICGKEIHSHSEIEGATIDPREVTCKKCLTTKEWKEDYKDSNEVTVGIKRRIYIESDILHSDEFRDAQRTVVDLCKENQTKYVRRVFSEVLDYAWHDLEKTWGAVKKADEIYSNSSLVPLCGGSYMGAPVIFNGMCERAIKEKIKGKDVFILNSLSNINWYMIKIDVMKEAFKHNSLFMYDKDYELTKVDVSKIKK